MEKILGLDYGDARVGVAISDELGFTAQAISTIHYKGDMPVLLEDIGELIEKYDIKKIVIGYPKNMNGTIGFRAKKTDDFIKILIDNFNLDVVKWNEWLTTVAAYRDMLDMNVKKKKKRGIVDTLAAVHILQNYLDSLTNKANV